MGNIDINPTPDIMLRGSVGGGLHTARPFRRGVRCQVDTNSKCRMGGGWGVRCGQTPNVGTL